MRQQQLVARRLTTIFTITVFLLPLLFYAYSQYGKEWAKVIGFFTEATFVVFIFTGIVGTYKTVVINNILENDIMAKLKAQGKKVERVGYNEYKLNGEPTIYAFDLNSIPSETVQIDSVKKIIKYT